MHTSTYQCLIVENLVDKKEDVVKISRIGAIILIVMYAQLLFFQLKTHAHTFNNGGDDSEDGEYCWSFWLEAWMGFVKNSIWGDHLSV
eukprot:CCRYP_016585-RA/>CCRYP_016585-RA protein AED:0.46 eAED:0.61 QI:0/0/0/1/0/0/3/0/87